MDGKARLAMVALCGAALAVPAAGAAPRTGKVVRVVDQDTVLVKVKSKVVRVHLRNARGSGCSAGEAKARLRSLLPRGARVRIGGGVVHRGRRQINRELRTFCAPEPPHPDPTPQPTPQPTPSPQPGPVDSAENRAELDAFLRGFRFTVHDSHDAGPLPGEITGTIGFTRDLIQQFCADGRYVARKIYTGSVGDIDQTISGTWKVHSITQRDASALAGNVEVKAAPPGGAPDTTYILAARKADGTGAFMLEDEQKLAGRAPTDAC